MRRKTNRSDRPQILLKIVPEVVSVRAKRPTMRAAKC